MTTPDEPEVPQPPVPPPAPQQWVPPVPGAYGGQPPVYEIPSGPLGWDPAPVPSAPKKSRWPIVVTSIVAVLAVVGAVGGYTAYRALSGGGTQPEAVLPADSFAFADVDLDPSATQKVNAFEFLHKLPKVGSAFDQRNDLKKSVWNAIAGLGGVDKDVNYENDIKPWLGDRLAVAARPPLRKGGSPDVLLVVQSKNDTKVRAAIATLSRDASTQVYLGFTKGFVIMSDAQAKVDRAIADAAKSSLKKAAHFAADMKAIGDQGFSSGWLDVAALVRNIPGSLFGGLAGSGSAGSGSAASPFGALDLGQSRLAFAMRFLEGGAEVVFKAFGAQQGATAAPPTDGFPTLGDLPSDTAGALRVHGLGQNIDRMWDGFAKGFAQGFGAAGGSGSDPIRSFEREFGVSLPGDLKTLLGTDLIAAVSGTDLRKTPEFGVRTHTDPTAAGKVLQSLEDHGVKLPGWKPLPDGVVVASTESYADLLAKPTGPTLSGLTGFRKALPDAGTGQFELYVNLAQIADQFLGQTGSVEERQAMKALDSFGMSVKSEGDTTTGVLRVILR